MGTEPQGPLAHAPWIDVLLIHAASSFPAGDVRHPESQVITMGGRKLKEPLTEGP